jgi:hypothetical protein
MQGLPKSPTKLGHLCLALAIRRSLVVVGKRIHSTIQMKNDTQKNNDNIFFASFTSSSVAMARDQKWPSS